MKMYFNVDGHTWNNHFIPQASYCITAHNHYYKYFTELRYHKPIL